MIGIHHRAGSFSDNWVEWCRVNQTPCRLVDAYSSSIVRDLEGCAGLMWHWRHDSDRDQQFARQLTLALASAGIPVFPNVATAWHYDDKVAQKYLFEALSLPCVTSHVFYTRESALAFVQVACYPVVFKLRAGAGSLNVQLVQNAHQAARLVRRAFGRGFPVVDAAALAKDAAWRFRRDRTLRRLAGAAYWRLRSCLPVSMSPERQRGYAYFQDFVPNNEFDHRFIVIGNRCFCIQRRNRPGDFRASGSGLLSYDPGLFPRAGIELAFTASERLGTQVAAFDVLYLSDGQARLVEVSYAYPTGAFAEDCPGYFDRDFMWHEGQCRQADLMIAEFAAAIGVCP